MNLKYPRNMQCDMCGKNVEGLQKSKVEGVVMNVCSNCAKYGERIVERKVVVKGVMPSKNKRTVRKLFNVPEMDSEDVIVSDYAKRIIDARRAQGISTQALSVKLAEKESLIKGLESSRHEPSMRLAKKIEKLLNIKLIEKLSDNKDEEGNDLLSEMKKNAANRGDKLTLGDIIKIRKRK